MTIRKIVCLYERSGNTLKHLETLLFKVKLKMICFEKELQSSANTEITLDYIDYILFV